jgi:hypothetical protein
MRQSVPGYYQCLYLFDHHSILILLIDRYFVSVHKAPHLLFCRALEVHKVVCAPNALHLRYPVNAHNEVV